MESLMGLMADSLNLEQSRHCRIFHSCSSSCRTSKWWEQWWREEEEEEFQPRKSSNQTNCHRDWRGSSWIQKLPEKLLLMMVLFLGLLWKTLSMSSVFSSCLERMFDWAWKSQRPNLMESPMWKSQRDSQHWDFLVLSEVKSSSYQSNFITDWTSKKTSFWNVFITFAAGEIWTEFPPLTWISCVAPTELSCLNWKL